MTDTMTVVMPNGDRLDGVPVGTPKADIMAKWQATQNGGYLKNAAAGPLSVLTSLPDTVLNALPGVGQARQLGGMLGTVLSKGKDPHGIYSALMNTDSAPISHVLNSALPDAVNPEKVTQNTFGEKLVRGATAGLTGALIPGGEGFTVGNMLRNAALGATSGAGAVAGGEGAAALVPEKFKPAARVVGSVVGGVAAPVAAVSAVNGIKAGMNAAKSSYTPPPSINELNAAKKATYATVDNSTMKISQPAVAELFQGVKSDLEKMGLTDSTMGSLAPKAKAALGALEDVSTSPQTLQGMEMQRRIAGLAAGSIDKTDRMAARIIQDHIDDFVQNLSPEQLSGPIDQAAIDALPQARSLAQRSFKAQTIQNLIEKAKTNATGFGQSGLENSIRAQFRKLANNERGMARFNPAEQEAIRRVVTGGNWYSANNLLRDIGKAAPYGALPLILEGQAAVGAGLTGGVPGLAASLAIPAVGALGRAGATSMTKAAAQNALDIALRGGTKAAPGATIGQILHSAASGALPTTANLGSALRSSAPVMSKRVSP